MQVASKGRRLCDVGVLVIRVGLGAMYIAHGLPKLLGGPSEWGQIGGAMANFGVHSAPEFWGLLAGLTETGAGLLLMLGLLTRLACLGLSFDMLVALSYHVGAGDPFSIASHPAELLIVLLGVLVMGAGRHSIDARISARIAGRMQRRREARADRRGKGGEGDRGLAKPSVHDVA